MDETQHTRGETPQQWHWVSALVDRHRLGDEVIICRGGPSVIVESTPREQVMRETCVTLFSGHVDTMHEQRILGSAEVSSQYASGLQTMYRHIIERVDGRPSGDGWQVLEGSTYLESIAGIRYTSIDCIQGGLSVTYGFQRTSALHSGRHRSG